MDLFIIGTELVLTETREKEWRAIIAALRAVTGGIPYTYGANWYVYDIHSTTVTASGMQGAWAWQRQILGA